MGVDDMDLFKGIELKLLALEQVLDQHAEWRGKLILVQVSNPPRSGHPCYPCRSIIHAPRCSPSSARWESFLCDAVDSPQ